MLTRLKAFKARLVRAGRRAADAPGQTACWVLALTIAVYVVAYPFWVCTYPPLTDLPFHAAQTSILRHYWDPEFHFREQFTLHPLEVPYISMYALGALLALVMPIVSATKLMAIVMLGMLPAGLAVMFWGMKKSPLWGLCGAGLVWGHLTHWGFLNYVGAIGLYAMCIGLALRALDAPSRARSLWLTLGILAVFLTHIYRLPFTLLSVLLTAAVMYPATRRVRPVLAPVAAGIIALALWSVVRTKDESQERLDLAFRPERMGEVKQYLFNGFSGAAGKLEAAGASSMLDAVLVAALVACVLFWWQGRLSGRTRSERFWGLGVTLLPLLLAGSYLLTFLTLPMRIGIWWYVYPREITTAGFVLLAVLPDMPKQWWYRMAFVIGLGLPIGRFGLFVAQEFKDFDESTEDFRRIAAEVPPAPKLMYLVFDHSGSTKRSTPYIHLPAWIQAEKGGWLGFHFVGFNHSPIRYRSGSPSVPPSVPERWEWTPQRFQVAKHGAWFDTFLVRGRDAPRLFAADPSIQLVRRDGNWWLFRRTLVE